MKNKSTTNLKIFVTAYAINPYKGSEDGMGWNFVLQIARNQKVIAVTRKNNGPAIEKYCNENPQLADLVKNIEFRYYDWPKWMIFWKKGPVLSLIYYYFWQISLAIYFRKLRHEVDVVHNLNFHNDWTPSFLWLWSKPFVWGPVGHHPVIHHRFLRPFYARHVFMMDRFLWLLKNIFWIFDPFLKITARKASHVFCMHREAAMKLKLSEDKYSILPSVASEDVEVAKPDEDFLVISAGRFVALKGFDITLRAFHEFYSGLSDAERKKVKLILVGSGPEKKRLVKAIRSLDITRVVEIIEWIPREELKQLYRKASVFLFPSHEGAGMVVSEAMSYGLPVLCWDNCGPGRFISPDSQLRVFYRPGEAGITKFALLLNKLKNDKAFYEKERQLARERFENYFMWDLRAAELSRVYNKVVQQPVSEVSFKPAFDLNPLA